MTTEYAIEVLQSHKSHLERLLREKICDKTEGTDFINAVDMAISALTEKKNPYIAQIKVDISLIQDFVDNLKDTCEKNVVEIEGKNYISVESLLSILEKNE